MFNSELGLQNSVRSFNLSCVLQVYCSAGSRVYCISRAVNRVLVICLCIIFLKKDAQEDRAPPREPGKVAPPPLFRLSLFSSSEEEPLPHPSCKNGVLAHSLPPQDDQSRRRNTLQAPSLHAASDVCCTTALGFRWVFCLTPEEEGDSPP